MTREGLIDTLARAMFRQGHGVKPKEVKFSNPGFVRFWDSRHPVRTRDGALMGHPTKPIDGAFVDFDAWAMGDTGKALDEGWRVFRALIWQYIEGKYNLNRPPTLRQMIAKYAPSADGNDPKVYTENVAAWAGVDPDVVLKDLITE